VNYPFNIVKFISLSCKADNCVIQLNLAQYWFSSVQ